MGFWLVLLAALLVVGLFWAGARWANGGELDGEGGLAPQRRPEPEHPNQDLGANINPSQLGNERDKWPDRTGARTRMELGAEHAADVTFVGDREEQKKVQVRQSARVNHAGGTAATRPANDETAYGVVQSDPAAPAIQSGVRREVQPGPHEHGPGTQPAADLAPEDEFGEDRPANRTTAPDQPPTRWHPPAHGVPGDHYRDGHHRSATAPMKQTGATDPYAHAPVPGPNHVPPEEGQKLPDNARP